MKTKAVTEVPSQPTRAAWIEMLPALAFLSSALGRSPLGLRGLKSYTNHVTVTKSPSQPTRAAWIEIEKELKAVQAELASQPTRAAWIEICNFPVQCLAARSQPTRAAWIEIFQCRL